MSILIATLRTLITQSIIQKPYSSITIPKVTKYTYNRFSQCRGHRGREGTSQFQDKQQEEDKL